MSKAAQPTVSKSKPLRVCYFGTYREGYARNKIMIAGLRRHGVQVIECHQRLWEGAEDRVQAASGGWRRGGFLIRLLRVYSRLLRQFAKVGDFDVMVLGYPGQLDTFLARWLSRRRGTPLVLDVFMSLALIAHERGLDTQSPVSFRLLQRLEQASLRLPDALIQDTEEYKAWLQATYGIPGERIALVPTGADDRIVHPLPVALEDRSRTPQVFTATYAGTFIPNHGVDYMIEAARILADDKDIQLNLIGDGPEKSAAVARVAALGLENVSFEGWLPQEVLVRRLAAADVVLGAFGKTPQSLMTVQNKIYEGLAMGKAVVTGDSPAVRRNFAHGSHLYLCNRDRPEELAEGLRRLKNDQGLRDRLAHEGLARFQEAFTIEQIGRRFVTLLRRIGENSGK